jgi:hypothetical protein
MTNFDQLLEYYALRHTGLLGEAPGGLGHPFSHAGIDIDHKKKVDLGVLRGADHDGRGPVLPFPMVDGVYVKFKPGFDNTKYVLIHNTIIHNIIHNTGRFGVYYSCLTVRNNT